MKTTSQFAQTHKVITAFFLIFGIFLSGFSTNNLPSANLRSSNSFVELSPSSLQDFQLLSTNQGWLLFDNKLYWTDDGGGSWNNITPPNLNQWVINSVSFLDTKNGWLILMQSDQEGFSSFALARTANTGTDWQIKALSLFRPADINSLIAAVSLDFIDMENGWIVIKQATSSNFTVGTLFRTTDGGDTWSQLNIPIGEPVYFVTKDFGWTAGGPAGDKLFRTQDGGQSWVSQSIGLPSRDGSQRRTYQFPKFENLQDGLLPTVVTKGDQSQIEFYSTHDGGESWNVITDVSLGKELAPGVRVPLTIFDAERVVMVNQSSKLMLKIVPSAKSSSSIHDDIATGIVELDMATEEIGWASYASGHCTLTPAPGSNSLSSPDVGKHCVSETKLLTTADGGQNWQALSLPNGKIALNSESTGNLKQDSEIVPLVNSSSTVTTTSPGFDKCEIPGLSQMQDWWNNSPYYVVNFYMPSANRGCSNSALSSSYLSQLSQQGWLFIPTWVGLQGRDNHCSNVLNGCSTFSTDPTTAYNQGVSEANSAADTATNLGMGGTIIYKDIEAFGYTNSTYRTAAQSFVSGWVAQLHARGYQAGVYGSSAASAIDYYYSITNRPDAIWPAGGGFWSSSYSANATVWGNNYVPDSHWNNHQRIHQYTSGHNELWGSTTLNIDSDVLDGIVAAYGGNGCNPNADQIALFTNSNYGGNCVTKGVGDYTNPSAIGLANDSISSVKVGGNVKVTLCRDDNYAGTCELFVGDDSDLSNNSIGNDQVSSAKVETHSSCPVVSGLVRLFDGQNCATPSIDAGLGLMQLEQNNFNDKAESIAIPTGWSARLYQNNNENTNESKCSSSTDPNLMDDTFANGGTVGNQVTWVRVYNNSSCTGGNPPDPPTPLSPINGYSFNEGESINLSWSATGSEYYGEISGGPGGTLTFGWQTATSKNIGSQWAGYVYTWHVKARNSYGESSWSFAPTFIVRPGAPSNLSASVASCSQINLSWSDNSGNEEGYKVYRNGNLIATLGSGATSHPDTGLSQNINYSYLVTAYRGNVESNASNTVNTTTSTCPVRPNTPSNFRVNSSTQTSIALAWDNVSNETGYKIYEWNGSGFVYLAYVGADVTSFTDSRSSCGWDQYYELSAFNGTGESAHTLWIHGNTLPCTPSLSVPGNGSSNPYNYDLTFEWNSASGATEYLIEWWGGPYSAMQPCGWGNLTSCHIGTVIPGNTYSWHIKARNSAGESPWSSTWTFTIHPQNFTLTVSKTGTGTGTVTSNPVGIICGSMCSYEFNANTDVTLTAIANSDSTFTSWSGGGCTGNGLCVVSMTAAKSVTANFAAIPTNTDIYMGGIKQDSYYIPPHGSMRKSFPGVNNGPVKFINTDQVKMIAAERVIYTVNHVPTSFSEMMALPDNQLDSTYWLPWYNNVDLDTQLRFGNVSNTTATVNLSIGGQPMTSGCLVNGLPSNSPYTLPVGESLRVSCTGVNSGPVQIESDQNIVAAERVIYKVNNLPTSFTEMMALPDGQLDSTYWLPWYNNVDLDTQLRFGNVSGVQATVRLYIGGQEKTSGCLVNGLPSNSPYTLAAGASLRVSCTGVNNGPVQIISNQNIVAAERVIYKINNLPTSFTEMMALPDSQLDSTYQLPWYNTVDLDTQLRFGNVSGAQATVRLYIGGQEKTSGCLVNGLPSNSPYTLAVGASLRVTCTGVNSGPVQIISNQNIVAAERVIYRVNGAPTSFSEMMALPNSQLNTTFWLPWYNNIDLDTQLRFGVP